MEHPGIRPLNARSLILSVLLGLPRPRLAASSPARLAELFGIAPGTMRTAISRMLATRELAAVDGGYELRGERWDWSWFRATANALSPLKRLENGDAASLRRGER